MPPPAVAIGDIVQVVLQSDVISQTCLNVLYYKCFTLPTNTSYGVAMDALANTVYSGAGTGTLAEPFVAALANNCALEGVQVQRVYPQRDYYLRVSIESIGAQADNCTATNVSGVINKRADRAGRGRHGSFHMPGVPYSAYSNGRVTDEYTGALNTLGAALSNGQILVSGSNYVWQPILWTPGNSGETNYSRIILCEAMRTLRVVRRRTVGLGI